MDTKLLASIIIVVVVLFTFLAYDYVSFSSTNENQAANLQPQAQPPLPRTPNPVDPAQQYSDYTEQSARIYTLDAFIIGKNGENLTFRTNQRTLTLKRPELVRFFVIEQGVRRPVNENELRQNEPVRVAVITDLSKGSVEALSVTAARN